MVHNFYQQPGGEDQSFASEVAMLREYGNEVSTWSVHNDSIAELSKWQVAVDTVWNRKSARTLHARIAAEGPFDIVHFQNTFPLVSPSAIWSAGRSRPAVVQTLRNYRLLCTNGLFFRNGAVCELCIGRRMQVPGIVHACYRGSSMASAVVATMNFAHRVIGTHDRSVDAFIALSAFARSKYAQAGLDQQRTHIKPNFVTPDPGVGDGLGNYAVFVGRLSPEKGIRTLLEAWSDIGKRLPLKIVGDGPEAEFVKTAAAASHGAVTWLGQRTKDEVLNVIGSAKLLVFPSEWYETFGRVAIEAFAKGTPVIVSNLGAIAELVEGERAGLLFEVGNAQDLIRQVHYFLNNEAVRNWRHAARIEFENLYSASRNYSLLMRIYESAIARKHGAQVDTSTEVTR